MAIVAAIVGLPVQPAWSTSGDITTIVGKVASVTTGPGPAVDTVPGGVLVDGSRVLVADYSYQGLRAYDTITGLVSNVTGVGSMYYPVSLTRDASGNVYVAEQEANRVSRVTPAGAITIIAGGNDAGFSGDGLPATLAKLNRPGGVEVDSAGNIYIADTMNNRIRKVDTSGIISTVAGTGVHGLVGDGGPATAARFTEPSGLAFDGAGNLFIADRRNHRIRRIDTAGVITTVAGSGGASEGAGSFSGDGGPATSATLNFPRDVEGDATGNVYIADQFNHRVRRIDPSGIITTVAGIGPSGLYGSYGGDGGPATSAHLNHPTGVSVDGSGNLFIADGANGRVRKVDPSGVISTAVGTGQSYQSGPTPGYGGDGGPATKAHLNQPSGMAIDSAGNLFVADTSNNVIRKIDPAGTVNTLTATGLSLKAPRGVAVDSAGNVYIADTMDNQVRKVDTMGVATVVAGKGKAGSSGDNGPATLATLNQPSGVAVDSAGNIFIADTLNQRVREVNTAGLITTVAGTGTAGYGGDKQPAVLAKVKKPNGVWVDPAGTIYIADTGNQRVRKVDQHGIITTVAGKGLSGAAGDGGAATNAKLNLPRSVMTDGSGRLLIVDSGNHRVRRVSTAGTITTIAGNGTAGYAGDQGPATACKLNAPWGVAVDSLGNVDIADTANNLIRQIAA